MAKVQAWCPSLKRCFPTRASAENERDRLGGGHGRVYRCECSFYHVASSAHRRAVRAKAKARARGRTWRA